MKDSNLSRWLYQNKCFLAKDSKLEKTHLCLDGGRLHIPPGLLSDFYGEYSKGLLTGEKYYICETITPVTRMYCDFDFVGEAEVDDIQLENWSKVCRKVILDKFGRHYDFTICKSECKVVQKNKRKQIKSGVHFIWKDLFVDVDIATRVSMALIDAFTEEFTNVEWKEVIDLGVYKNGLRMVGSRKVTNKKRKVKVDENDEEKNDTTKIEYEIIKVDEGRAYIPYMVASADETVKTDEDQICYYNLKQLKQILFDNCIRAYNKEKPTEPVKDLPSHPESTKTKSTGGRDTDIEDPKVFDRVEEFIRFQTIPQWNSSMCQLRRHGKFYIAKIESMYCMNAQRDHNSCGIYFQITEHGLFQRCFCRCDTVVGRVSGICSEYKSTPFPLPKEVMKMLFPNFNSRKPNRSKVNNACAGRDVFGSNILMKKRETLPVYLKMSLNTILLIEKKCH
jgi:hypothetical protein